MELLIVLGAAIAVIWATVFLARGSLVLGAAWYLVLTSVFGTYFARFDVGPVTLSLDRLYLVALAVAFLVQFKLRRVTLRPPTAADGIFAAYLGWLAISLVTHDFRSAHAGDVPIVQHYLNGYLIPATLYFIVRNSRLSDADLTGLFWILTGFGVYLGLTGIAETTGQWWAVWPKYIAKPDLGLHFGRARGPMVQSVSYGLYLGACLMAALAVRTTIAKAVQPFLMATYPVLLAAVFLTKTRSVWAGTATALGTFLMLTLPGRARIFVVLLGLAGAVGVVAAKSDAILFLKRETSAADTKKSADMRACFAYVSWKMFLDKPVAGFGFGQFAAAKRPYLQDRSSGLDLESIRPYVHHNTFLAALTETGVIGLGLMLTTLAAISLRAWRLIRSQPVGGVARSVGVVWLAVLASALWQMAAHEITFMTYEQSLIYTFGGLVVGLTLSRRERPADDPWGKDESHPLLPRGEKVAEGRMRGGSPTDQSETAPHPPPLSPRGRGEPDVRPASGASPVRRRVPGDIVLEAEFAAGGVAAHVADLAEDRPLRPPGSVVPS